MQLPAPPKSLQSSAVKIPVLHESGQQRIISLPYSVQYWMEFEQLYELSHPGDFCRHSLLSFGVQISISIIGSFDQGTMKHGTYLRLYSTKW